MKNLADSEIMKAHPKNRKQMLEEEQIIRDCITSRDEGTLEIIDDDLSTTDL